MIIPKMSRHALIGTFKGVSHRAQPPITRNLAQVVALASSVATWLTI